MSESSQFGLALLSWLILACTTGVLVFFVWHSLIRPSKLMPPQRQRRVGWSGVEVLIAFFLIQLFWIAVADEALKSIPTYSLNLAAKPVSPEIVIRHGMWVNLLAFPFAIAGTLILFRVMSGTPLYQLGISSHNLARGTVLGWLAWLLVSPVILALHMTVQILYLSGTGAQPEEHGLTMLAMNTSSVLDWILIVGSAVILAPLKEELLFRGVAQFWFSRRSWGGHVAMIAAFIVAIVERYDKLHQAIVKHTWSLLVHELQPALFVIALIPVYLVLPRLLSRRFPLPEVPRAIFGTSLLFGVFHSTVWPTPIPLFVLGLVLGWLAYRTQSLTAPIVLHALFNAVACLGLALLR